MGKKLVSLFVIALIVAGGFVATSANAKDAKGCEGLADYRVAMFKVGRSYLEANADDGIPFDRDPLTFSSDDWADAASNALQFQRDIKSVTPPNWAMPWHVLKIEFAGLVEQAFRAISTGGILMSAGFSEPIDANGSAADSAVKEITKTCPVFADFQHDWSALDGDIDGTPVATPTD